MEATKRNHLVSILEKGEKIEFYHKTIEATHNIGRLT